MSEHTDATEDRPDDEGVEQAREDRVEEESGAKEPQPWAKALPGDTD